LESINLQFNFHYTLISTEAALLQVLLAGKHKLWKSVQIGWISFITN